MLPTSDGDLDRRALFVTERRREIGRDVDAFGDPSAGACDASFGHDQFRAVGISAFAASAEGLLNSPLSTIGRILPLAP